MSLTRAGPRSLRPGEVTPSAEPVADMASNRWQCRLVVSADLDLQCKVDETDAAMAVAQGLGSQIVCLGMVAMDDG